MNEFQQKRKIKKLIYSKKTVGLLIIILCVMANATYKVYRKDQNSREALVKSQREYEKLNERKADLVGQFDRLQTDQGIEEVIRQKFQVVKPGEQIAVILNDQDVATTTPIEEGRGFWYRLTHPFR